MAIRHNYVLVLVDLNDPEAFRWAVEATCRLEARYERLLGARIVVRVPLGQALEVQR